MSRRWLGILLLLSLGMNLGILGVLGVERVRNPEPATVAGGPAELAGDATPQEGRRPPVGRPGALGNPRRGPSEGPLAGSQPREGGGPPPAIAWRLEHLADRLGLEGETRDRFVELQHGFFTDTFRRHRRIVRLQERFRRELAAPEPSEETLDELARELSALRAGLDDELARTVLETRKLLGPEQEREYLRFVARIGPGGSRPRRPAR